MSRPRPLLHRLAAHPILPAFAALAWLILRSGRKPARLTYPCQQAALGTSTLLLGVPLAHALVRLAAHLPLRRRHALATGVITAALALAVVVDPIDRTPAAHVGAAPADYVASLYVVTDVPMPLPDRHPGVDDLVACMADGGLDLYRSTTTGPATGPNGIIGVNDVVLVKVNQQWAQCGGTNTDVLRGVIRRIVEHPDGFTGEIVVVENTQNYGTLDWPYSNAEDTGQSVMDVVADFQIEGWPVGAFLWDTIRASSVAEYADGDLADGYVVSTALDPESQIRVSYPKFRTPGGRYVSLARGVWDTTAGAYDDDRLTFISMPVLKCHSIYGVTAAVKHHMGSMTTALSTGAHAGVARGGCGSFLAEVRMPDLNVLDCINILARPGSGPYCAYEQATRVNRLVAGVDPVALDMWAVTNILVPTMISNGFPSYPAQDPSDPGSTFRTYLDRSMSELHAAGIPATNDLAHIEAHTYASTGVDPDPETGGSAPDIRSRVVPNPFRARTMLALDGRTGTDVGVEIVDPTGRFVRSLAQVQASADGATAEWDGRDDRGRPVAAGVYVYRFVDRQRGHVLASGRITLLR